MGTSKSVAQFSGKIAKAAKGIENANRDALVRASRSATLTLDGAIASMTGGDMVARNAPREGAPSRMSARAGHVEGTARALVKIGPKGPVALLDQGSPSHVIGFGRGIDSAGYGALTRSRRTLVGGINRAYNLDKDTQLLRIGDQFRWGPFLHPGTQGKRRWTTTRDTVLPKTLPPILFAPHTQAVARAFL